MYFVWVKGLRGSSPQLWGGEPVDGNGKPSKEALFKIKLPTEDLGLTLDQLAVKYEKDRPTCDIK